MAKPSLTAAIAKRLSEAVIDDPTRDVDQRIAKKTIQDVILKNKDVDDVPSMETWRRRWHQVMDRMSRANAAEGTLNWDSTIGRGKTSKTEITILDGAKVKAVAQAIVLGEPEFGWKTQPQSTLEKMEAAIILDLGIGGDSPIEFGEDVQWRVYWDYRSEINFEEFAKAWQIVAIHLLQAGQLLVSGGTGSSFRKNVDIVPQYLVLKDRKQLAAFSDDPLSLLTPAATHGKSGIIQPQVKTGTFTQLSQRLHQRGVKTFGYVCLSEKSQDADYYRTRLRRSGASEVFVDQEDGVTTQTSEWDHLMSQVHAGDTVIIPGLQRFPQRGSMTQEVIFELLDHEVNLQVTGIEKLLEFKYGALTRDSQKLLDMYYEMFRLLPDIAKEQINEAIGEYKEH